MSDFEKLAKMDIDEIHKTTKLTIARLEDVMQKRFDKLDRVRALGFIAILEREYKLDLSDWKQEYESYCKKIQEQKEALENPQKIETKEEVQEKPNNEIKQEEKNEQTLAQKIMSNSLSSRANENVETKPAISKKTKIIIAILIILILIVIYITHVISNVKESVNNNEKATQTTTQESQTNNDLNITQNEQNQNSANDNATSSNEFNSYQNNQDSQILQNNENVQNNSQNVAQDLQNQNAQTAILNQNTGQNITTDSQDLQNTQDANMNQNINTVQNNAQSNGLAKITITPRSDLWLGVMNLKTKKASEKVVAANSTYELYLSENALFKFGHTDLVININGKEMNYSNSKPSRFIYKNGELSTISYRDFNKLAGKKLWH